MEGVTSSAMCKWSYSYGTKHGETSPNACPLIDQDGESIRIDSIKLNNFRSSICAIGAMYLETGLSFGSLVLWFSSWVSSRLWDFRS